MTPSRRRKPRPPLDPATLDELAVTYVGRFATSKAKLLAYLERKLRERGWGGDLPPDLDSLVGRLASLGYIDDRGFALAKARSLTSRGYGERRVGLAIRTAGIAEDEGREAMAAAQAGAVESALHYARRKSIGPYARSAPDQAGRERALASMIRAGHRFGLSRAIVDLEPGTVPDIPTLEESC